MADEVVTDVPAAEVPLPAMTRDGDCPAVLRDMFFAYLRPKGAGESLGVRMARRMMEKDPFKFADKLARLQADFQLVLDQRVLDTRAMIRQHEADEEARLEKERAEEEREKREAAEKRAERKAGREADAPAMDRGSAACLALAEKLLADRPWEGGA